MKLTSNLLINYLINKNSWTNATDIANHFSVSTRTVRNRIAEINIDAPNTISSSHYGYAINKEPHQSNDRIRLDEHQITINFVIRELIKSDTDISIYDLADSLYISDSSFEKLLKDIKLILKEYNLNIFRKRNRIKIIGNEKNKRKLINNLITKESKNSYMFLNNEFFFSDISTEEIKEFLLDLFETDNLFMNDYGFYSIFFHVIVLLERVVQGNYLPNEFLKSSYKQIHYYKTSVKIINYLQNKYNVVINESEKYYLTLIISNNVNIIDYSIANISNLHQYVDSKYINLTNRIIDSLKENYCLDNLNSDFMTNLTIHISNLFARTSNDSYTHNPLSHMIKDTYPLIYDMATFIAKHISEIENVKIIDDEIAFIALHIGAYFENTKNTKNKINCCYIYADYHNFHIKSVEEIKKTFDSSLYLSLTISIKDIEKLPDNIDLIISSFPEDLNINIPTVYTSVFITEKDLNSITNAIKKICNERKKVELRNSLNHFIGNNLFKKDFYTTDHIEMIKYLANECIELNLCSPTFLDEVLEREELSSTSFTNSVAVPHSLNLSAYQSFLSVVLNNKGIQWGDNIINIVVMIGTCKTDREAFKKIFDELIAILYDQSNVQVLIRCDDYDSFISKIIELMNLD